MNAILSSHFSHVRLFATLWTVARQTLLSIGFSRQEYWSGLQCPPPGNLPDPGIKPMSLMSPALTGGFFTTSATWEDPVIPTGHLQSHWKILLKLSENQDSLYSSAWFILLRQSVPCETKTIAFVAVYGRLLGPRCLLCFLSPANPYLLPWVKPITYTP